MENSFFYIAKLTWLLMAPESLLLLWLFLCLLCLCLGSLLYARRLLLGLILTCLLIGLFPVGEWLLYPLESRYQANPQLNQVDGIIVLGGAENVRLASIWQQTSVNAAGERLLALLALLQRYPQAKVVFTGGSGSMTAQHYKSADMVHAMLQRYDVSLEQVTFESKSRNTHENALFSKTLLQPSRDATWLLVTSAWHMPRAMAVFCQADWAVLPYPVDFRSLKDHLLRLDWDFAKHLVNLNQAVKEWVGLLAYRWTDRSC
jgi:uncharacterized SAM-binding protein YcdF (DUF218 family)